MSENLPNLFTTQFSALLNLKLQQRDKTGSPRAAAISLNRFLDQWLTTVARPKLRAKTFCDYQTLLRLYIRPVLGGRLIGTIGQIDMQELYAQLFERGLSARALEDDFRTLQQLNFLV